MLVLEVDGLKGHEGDDGGHFLGAVDVELGEGLGDVGGCLFGGAAFLCFGAFCCVGGDLLDDFDGVEVGGCGGGYEGEGKEDGETHFGGLVFWYWYLG